MSWILLNHEVYDYARTYEGPAEECLFEFSLGPEQIPFTNWFRDLIVNAFEKEVVKQHGRMLELTVWEDKAPTWTTDYHVTAIASSPVTAASTSAAGVVQPALIFTLSWILIIKLVLVVIIPLIILLFVIKAINVGLFGPGGDDGGGGLLDPDGGLLGGFGSIIPLILIVLVMGMIMPIMSRGVLSRSNA